MNASSAVTNQKVSVCRLSGETRSIIIKAIDIARMLALKEELTFSLASELNNVQTLLKRSEEIWLIESKSI